MDENLMEKSFAGLTSAFDTTFQIEDEVKVNELITTIENQVDIIDGKKLELVNNMKEVALKDQTFLEDELRSLIVNTRLMLARLENEIRIGAKSGYWDSYSRLASSVTNQLRELRELNVAVVQTELSKSRLNNNINNTKRATIKLDANALIDLVNKAKADSQINVIDATFKIEENEEK